MIRRHVCAERISANVRPASLLRNALDHNYGMERLDICNSVVTNFVHGMIRTFSLPFPPKNLSISLRVVFFFFAKIDPKGRTYYQLSICVTHVSWQSCFKLNSFLIKIREKLGREQDTYPEMENFSIKKNPALFSVGILVFMTERSPVWVIWYICRVFVVTEPVRLKASLHLKKRNTRGNGIVEEISTSQRSLQF